MKREKTSHPARVVETTETLAAVQWCYRVELLPTQSILGWAQTSVCREHFNHTSLILLISNIVYTTLLLCLWRDRIIERTNMIKLFPDIHNLKLWNNKISNVWIFCCKYSSSPVLIRMSPADTNNRCTLFDCYVTPWASQEQKAVKLFQCSRRGRAVGSEWGTERVCECRNRSAEGLSTGDALICLFNLLIKPERLFVPLHYQGQHIY